MCNPVYGGRCSLAQASCAVSAATPCCLAPKCEHLCTVYFSVLLQVHDKVQAEHALSGVAAPSAQEGFQKGVIRAADFMG